MKSTNNPSRLGENPIGDFIVGNDTVYRSVNSHTSTITSNSSTVFSTFSTTSSHVGAIDSSVKSLISVYRSPSSHSKSITSNSSRSAANHAPSNVSSHIKPVSSFTYNERTSLDLIDYDVTWSDETASWHTPWVKQFRVLGSEDTMVVRGSSVDDSKDPCALVQIEYDKSGNESIDKKSEIIQVTNEDQIHEVSSVPLDEGGWYRMRIFEYSGYNSLYSLDMGMIH